MVDVSLDVEVDDQDDVAESHARAQRAALAAIHDAFDVDAIAFARAFRSDLSDNEVPVLKVMSQVGGETPVLIIDHDAEDDDNGTT
jgi:hypothetical protein